MKTPRFNSQECSYERCEDCLLFPYCETCYNEICLFENCNLFCGRCPVKCHRSPDIDFEQEADLQNLQVNKPIPALNARCAWFPTVRKNSLLRKLDLEIVAVKFEEIYNFKSNTIRAYDLHRFFDLPKSTKIILTFNIKDRILEKLWLTFRRGLLKLMLKELKVDYICSPNFSNYFDTPRYQWWRNVWRSISMANEFQELGFKIILDISSPVPAMHKYLLELIKRSKVKTLIFNCQTLKLNRYKEFAYDRFKFFDQLPGDVEFIICGLTSFREARLIYETLHRRFYFTSSSPYFKAVCQQTLRSHRRISKQPLDLMREYFGFYNQLHLRLRHAHKHTG